MTNAIEQAKREMYQSFENVKNYAGAKVLVDEFENFLESYLELLRQDHEALHETARKRFDGIQNLWSANYELQSIIENQRKTIKSAGLAADDLTQRLAKMIEERDSIQLRLHAVDHAYKEQQSKGATMHQDSGDRASCAMPGGNSTAIQGAAEDIRKISDAWAMTGRRAKKSMLKISGILARPEVFAALEAIEKPATCMHSFFAIADDQMKCTFCGVVK